MHLRTVRRSNVKNRSVGGGVQHKRTSQSAARICSPARSPIANDACVDNTRGMHDVTVYVHML